MNNERNTVAVSAYIDTSLDASLAYMQRLEHLNDWTLFSRMVEKVDDYTWLGTASCYQSQLYYHLRTIDTPRFTGIEWHCGLEYQNYFQVYPALLFPPSYVRPGSQETGSYLHWVSFVDPRRRTGMMEQAVELVHRSEVRSLKAILERKAGLSRAAVGEWDIRSQTIYIDAPLADGVAYLADVRNVAEWAHLLRADGQLGSDRGVFRDEYDQVVEVSTSVQELGKYFIVEEDRHFPQHEKWERCPTLLIPCSYAFGDPEATGYLQHRITFWPRTETPTRGRLLLEDYAAESVNIKRLIEARAGNLETFARGLSYLPRT